MNLNIYTDLEKGYLPAETRTNLKDIWNAFMVRDATFSANDIPLCPTYLPNGLPKKLIAFNDAKDLYNKMIKNGNTSFQVDKFIHFYIDDYWFDKPSDSVWLYPYKALEIIKHFAGIITVDFSTYIDFPKPLILYNTYRMRAFGYWIFTQGIPVINNVRWGFEDSWGYCFDGVDSNSVICIGTVASGIKEVAYRPLFENGLLQLVERLKPHTIIVYGSSNYDIFRLLERRGIRIISFPSKTSEAFKKGGEHHV